MPVLKATNKESGNWVTLDPDTYSAVYTHCNDFAGGTFGPALKLYFEVAYEDATGAQKTTEVSGIAGLPKAGAMGNRSKLRSWVEALIGRPLADQEEIDLDGLENTPCRLMLSTKEGLVRDDGTRPTFNRIEKVLPPRRRATKPPVGDEGLI